MRIGKFNFSREVIGVAELEKDQVIVTEVVLYTSRFRGDYRFLQGKVFEYARWRIDFGENISVVGDNPEITILDCLDNLVEIALTKIIYVFVEPALSGRFHHFLKEGGSLAANFQPDGRDHVSHLLKRIYGEVESVSVNQRAMIKNHKRFGAIAVFVVRLAGVRVLQSEDIVIRRIDYDLDFAWLTTTGRIDLFAREIHGEHEISKADAPLFHSLQHGYAETLLGQFEDRPHEFRHRIVQIQNDLCAEELRNDRAEDENIRHVMHVDEIVATCQ